MVKINSALLLYFVAVIFYVIAVMIGSDNLELFCKPIIIPSIYYFYYISVKGKANFLFTISILSFFIGEILHLISREDFLISGLIFFGIPYFIIIYFIGQDFLFYSKKKKYNISNVSFYIVLLLLFYLLYNVLSFINESSQLEFSIYIMYGIQLFVMGILTFLIQFNFNNRTVLYMVLAVTTFIVSDLFFVFTLRMKDEIALKLINIITQQLSYFFYVGYFIYRTKFLMYGKGSISIGE
ncbi:MAG: hypothetical protein ACH34V_04245 [Flavobacterium sp.]|uniref:hypothetical protein n=1 Tax=Flavobacterium sp. TaxID=239 RepID=UPI0037918EC3